jgi:hypothetical protein
MGNAAIEPGGDAVNDDLKFALDETKNSPPEINVIKSKSDSLPQERNKDQRKTETPQASEPLKKSGVDGEERGVISTEKVDNESPQVVVKKKSIIEDEKEPDSPQHAAHKKKQSPVAVVEEEEEVDAMDVLFQFIPYYGQGDTSHDSIVRSTLSSLSVEDIDHRDEYGNTLLLIACQYRCEPLVRIILNKGADPNALNTSGASCLHFACYKESMSKPIAKLLLRNGANPEVSETTFGCTPLHYCASTGDVDFCKMLLSYGAHVGTYDYYNYTCVDYAREAGMHEAAVFLQKKMLMTASQGPAGFAASRNGLYFGKTDQAVSKVVMTHQYSSPNLEQDSEWVECFDQASNGKYYMNSSTGECLWESDYLRKMAAEKDAASIRRVDSAMLDSDSLLGGTPPSAPKESKVKINTTPDVVPPPSVLSPINPSPALQKTMSAKEMSNSTAMSATIDPNTIKKLLDEAKLQSDAVLDQERLEFQGKIAERESKISKLESANQSLQRDKDRIEVYIECNFKYQWD